MSGMLNGVSTYVEAGVKSLLDIAEGYISPSEDHEEDNNTPITASKSHIPPAQPQTIPIPFDAAPTPVTSSSTISSQFSNPKPDVLIQTTDITSGWIHIQSTYLDGNGGQRKVRSFGLRNIVDRQVDVEVASDLGGQLVFWQAEDDKPPNSSASTSSSTSNNAGTTRIYVTIPPKSSTTIYLAFISRPESETPPFNEPTTPVSDDGGFTPRIIPVPSRRGSRSPSPIPMSSFDTASSSSHASTSSFPSKHGQSAQTSRRNEPVHRAFSIHGLITLIATPNSPDPPIPAQTISLPFYATICRSLFTACLITPLSTHPSSCPSPPISSGTLTLDFGQNCLLNNEYHRDILLVNRSEIDLIWTTHVLSSPNKHQVWLSLRDLDSENVFGDAEGGDGRPVPIPALSSRHLRLTLRVREEVKGFEFGFVIGNVNAGGNTLSCRALGGCGRGLVEEVGALKVSGDVGPGLGLDFGDLVDGSWGKKVLVLKNEGERGLDVKFGVEGGGVDGVEVGFTLGGIAGEDEEVGGETGKKDVLVSGGILEGLSRTSTRETGDRGRVGFATGTRGASTASPGSSIGRGGSLLDGYHGHGRLSPHLQPRGPSSFPIDLTTQLYNLDSDSSIGEFNKSQQNTPSESIEPHLLPASGPLSRITSRTSSYHYHTSADSDDEEDQGEEDHSTPFFAITAEALKPISPNTQDCQPLVDTSMEAKPLPDQIEEISMRPGTEYRVHVHYRPARDIHNLPSIAGKYRTTAFNLSLAYSFQNPSTRSSQSTTRQPKSSTHTQLSIPCTARSATSLISLESKVIDFGETTVGASKSALLRIKNESEVVARVEIAAISKVLSVRRGVVVVGVGEVREERLEFFPRRINERYEKQVFVRNLRNRANDQLVQIRSRNSDVHNLTLHSHLYRILTASGSNFVDFGPVVINSPTIRTVHFENLSNSMLLLELSASQPEDVELYVKMEDAAVHPGVRRLKSGKDEVEGNGTGNGNTGGELKERFMETLRESGTKSESVTATGKGKAREKSVGKEVEEKKTNVGVAVGTALKRGGRGRPVQLYGNAVIFKDRNLLESHEYLDLAAGHPVASHRTSPRSKKTALLDAIALEDRSKLSGHHPKIPKLDFAAIAKASGLLSKDVKSKKKSNPPTSPRPDHIPLPNPTIASVLANPLLAAVGSPGNRSGNRTPALTGKKAETKTEMFSSADISKMTVDELLLAIENHDAQRCSITHTTLDQEEIYVRRTISLRKELSNLISSGKLVPARTLSVDSKSIKQLIVIMTPNGSIRPHVTTRTKRGDSRVYIRLCDFDRALIAGGGGEDGDLPVRDLVIRSGCVRSVLEVQQSSINFGGCEKGEVKSKTIVIQNKSDCIGIFRLRTSGSIASGDLKLGLGRYGVISAFGRKEVETFSFTPSLVGAYNETITVENVLDSFNDQTVAVKAAVRKIPTFTVDPGNIEIPSAEVCGSFILTNVSKHERTFVLVVEGDDERMSLRRDEKDVGTALSKGEEEELEGLLQKLKIARRKGKTDKVEKYEARLVELGHVPDNTSSTGGEEEGEGRDSVVGTPITEQVPDLPTRLREMTITLGASQKMKVVVDVERRGEEVRSMVKVHDRKNTDEIVGIAVVARTGSRNGSEHGSGVDSSTKDPLHLALMRRCLELTLQCPVSPTAFCVGSLLYLPSSSSYHSVLASHFSALQSPTSTSGLVLSEGFSRQIPGNTHAEANALANFRSRYAELTASIGIDGLPPVDEVLKEGGVECFATMEPCSIRTSGGPSCALELVRAGIKAVYLGVEEPPDFVQCEGVQILETGGVVVRRVIGLEEDCLKAARRGRD